MAAISPCQTAEIIEDLQKTVRFSEKTVGIKNSFQDFRDRPTATIGSANSFKRLAAAAV
ncbi:MAG: hypothetical protein AAF609_00120 [Cyanobacteria bacterium P01_C01_bin.120]